MHMTCTSSVCANVDFNFVSFIIESNPAENLMVLEGHKKWCSDAGETWRHWA